MLVTIAVSLNVREQPGQSALEALSSHLQGKRLLLVLDNLEHLPESFRELAELLSACPGLTLLCTSRERLRLQGERVYELPPLSETESVSLFCERAQSEPDDPTRELCQKLEGLPLAIELAAARTSVLTPEQISIRLSQRLDFLKGGPDRDPRQETLRATIEWSYELLSLRSSKSSRAFPSSPAAARWQPPKRWRTPTSTRCSRSSTRASFASRTGATGCWSRSGSLQLSGWRRRARRRRFGGAMPSTSLRFRSERNQS